MLIAKTILQKRKISLGIVAEERVTAVRPPCQNEPVTSDGFRGQTIHSQTTYIQQNRTFVTGVLGFSGQKNAYKEVARRA